MLKFIKMMNNYIFSKIRNSERLSGLFFKSYFWLIKAHIKNLKKICNRHEAVIFYNAYLFTVKRFPDKKLSECLDYASPATLFLLNFRELSDTKYTRNSQIDEVINYIENNRKLRRLICDYHQIKALIVKTVHFDESYSETIEKHEKYAKEIYIDLRIIDNKNIGKVDREIKKELKHIKNLTKSTTKEKVELEGLKKFKPIKLRSQHLTFAITLFSTLFILSGYLYNKILFSLLGISVDDFFSVPDYISTSTNIIATTVWSLFFGGIVFLYGLRSDASLTTHNEQFGKEEDEDKSNQRLLLVILFISTFLGAGYYLSGSVEPKLVAAIIMLVLVQIYIQIPDWKYIKNRVAFRVFGLAIITSVTQVSTIAIEQIEDVKNPSYKGRYYIKLSDPNMKNKFDQFFSANSEFVFLWNTKYQVVKVIPKRFVMEYTPQ
ncbi:hypothetical protein KOI40_03100 [Aestuariicella sp. G3-2]|uniref:hypothetical protein n=1 Tax=Pseudomaricurvus albidus TaxID=2842452 RepID=UPI001C0B637C|nr:hypothetical protein [Aestuariicella albida]MBU3068789.1 hypothetical protein [Aestuariicella albida]